MSQTNKLPTTEKLSSFIRNGLKERGWSSLDFCIMLGLTSKATGSKIVNGKQAPTFTQMALIAKIFDINIKKVVEMRIIEEIGDKLSDISSEQQQIIDIYKHIPVHELIRNQWVGIQDRSDTAEIISKMKPIADDFKDLKAQARKTHPDDPKLDNRQVAWLLRVRQLAKSFPLTTTFDSLRVSSCVDELRQAMMQDSGIKTAPAILNKYGIKLVLVECKNSKIDGVCTWLSKTEPVIGMTLRYDRIDNFWFVLRHELAHIEQGHNSAITVDCDLNSAQQSQEQENDANLVAQEFCAPSHLVNLFISVANGKFSSAKAERFAKANGILPSALAGQIRHRLGKYNILSDMIKPCRADVVSASNIVDGWGVTVFGK